MKLKLALSLSPLSFLLLLLSLCFGNFHTSNGQVQGRLQDEQDEPPTINPKDLDPSLLSLCDSPLSSDDIYTGLMSLMNRMEGQFRKSKCPIDIHSFPIKVNTLFGRPIRVVSFDEADNNVGVKRFYRMIEGHAQALIEKSGQCRLDWVLLMKVISIAIKSMANILACSTLQKDILTNRAAWASLKSVPLKGENFNPEKVEGIGFGLGLGLGFTETPSTITSHFIGPYYDNREISFVQPSPPPGQEDSKVTNSKATNSSPPWISLIGRGPF